MNSRREFLKVLAAGSVAALIPAGESRSAVTAPARPLNPPDCDVGEITLRRPWSSELPIDRLLRLAGHVNSEPFAGCPAGTVQVWTVCSVSYNASPLANPDELMAMLAYRRSGWGWSLGQVREKIGGDHALVTFYRRPIYPSADLSPLLCGPGLEFIFEVDGLRGD